MAEFPSSIAEVRSRLQAIIDNSFDASAPWRIKMMRTRDDLEDLVASMFDATIVIAEPLPVPPPDPAATDAFAEYADRDLADVVAERISDEIVAHDAECLDRDAAAHAITGSGLIGQVGARPGGSIKSSITPQPARNPHGKPGRR